jgi:hypothetical protein
LKGRDYLVVVVVGVVRKIILKCLSYSSSALHGVSRTACSGFTDQLAEY